MLALPTVNKWAVILNQLNQSTYLLPSSPQAVSDCSNMVTDTKFYSSIFTFGRTYYLCIDIYIKTTVHLKFCTVTKAKFHTTFVGMVLIYLYIKLHMHIMLASLCTAIRFHKITILWFYSPQKYYLNRSCILSHTI